MRTPFLLAGGTLAPVAASSFAAELTIAAGTLAGVGDITLNGSTNWNGGTMEGTGKTIVGQNATLTTNAGVLNLWRSLDNAGTINWQPGRIDMIEAILTNLPTGIVFANGTGQVQGLSGVTRIINQGVFTRGGGGTTTFQPGVGFNNAGTLNTIDGVLRAFGGGVSTGTFNLGADMELAGTSVFFATSNVDGPAAVTFVGGSATVNGTFSPAQINFAAGTTTTFNGAVSTDVGFGVGSGATVELNNTLSPVFEVVVGGGTLSVNSPQSWPRLTVNAGELTGSGQISVTSQHTWNGGLQSGFGRTIVAEGATLTIGADVTLDRNFDNGGVADWNFGAISLQTAILTNLPTGVWNCRTSNQIADGTGASQVVNRGTWTTPGANVTLGGSVALNNTGTVDWSGGTFNISGPIAQLSGGTLSGGTWSARGSGTIQFPSTVTINQTILEFRNSGNFANLGLSSNEGQLRFLEGRGWAVGVATNSGSIVVEGGNSAPPTVNNLGTIRQTQSAQLTLSSGGSHTGDFIVESGQLRFNGSHTFTADTAISGAGSVVFQNFGDNPILATVGVTGEVRVESGTVSFATPLNVGTFVAQSGVNFLQPIVVQNFLVNGGLTLNFAAPAAIGSAGAWNSVTVDGAGPVSMSGSGSLFFTTWRGAGALTFQSGSTYDLSNTTLARPLFNHGALTLSGSYFSMDGVTLRNESDGRVNANVAVTRAAGAPVFDNFGVIGPGGFVVQTGVVFNHHGTFAAFGSSVAISGGGVATGSFRNVVNLSFGNDYTFQATAELSNGT
ncbi:MAG: beta strand repeat-containing protein, partial [Phycisphaerales bacterium]